MGTDLNIVAQIRADIKPFKNELSKLSGMASEAFGAVNLHLKPLKEAVANTTKAITGIGLAAVGAGNQVKTHLKPAAAAVQSIGDAAKTAAREVEAFKDLLQKIDPRIINRQLNIHRKKGNVTEGPQPVTFDEMAELVTAALTGGMEGFATGGPFGAIVGVAAALIAEHKTVVKTLAWLGDKLAGSVKEILGVNLPDAGVRGGQVASQEVFNADLDTKRAAVAEWLRLPTGDGRGPYDRAYPPEFFRNLSEKDVDTALQSYRHYWKLFAGGKRKEAEDVRSGLRKGLIKQANQWLWQTYPFPFVEMDPSSDLRAIAAEFNQMEEAEQSVATAMQTTTQVMMEQGDTATLIALLAKQASAAKIQAIAREKEAFLRQVMTEEEYTEHRFNRLLDLLAKVYGQATPEYLAHASEIYVAYGRYIERIRDDSFNTELVHNQALLENERRTQEQIVEIKRQAEAEVLEIQKRTAAEWLATNDELEAGFQEMAETAKASFEDTAAEWSAINEEMESSWAEMSSAQAATSDETYDQITRMALDSVETRQQAELEGLSNLRRAWDSTLDAVSDLLGDFLTGQEINFGKWIESIKNMFLRAFSRDVVDGVWNWIKSLLGGGISNDKGPGLGGGGLLGKIFDWVGGVFKGLFGGGSSGGNWLQKLFGGLAEKVKSFVKGFEGAIDKIGSFFGLDIGVPSSMYYSLGFYPGFVTPSMAQWGLLQGLGGTIALPAFSGPIAPSMYEWAALNSAFAGGGMSGGLAGTGGILGGNTFFGLSGAAAGLGIASMYGAFFTLAPMLLPAIGNLLGMGRDRYADIARMSPEEAREAMKGEYYDKLIGALTNLDDTSLTLAKLLHPDTGIWTRTPGGGERMPSEYERALNSAAGWRDLFEFVAARGGVDPYQYLRDRMPDEELRKFLAVKEQAEAMQWIRRFEAGYYRYDEDEFSMRKGPSQRLNELQDIIQRLTAEAGDLHLADEFQEILDALRSGTIEIEEAIRRMQEAVQDFSGDLTLPPPVENLEEFKERLEATIEAVSKEDFFKELFGEEAWAQVPAWMKQIMEGSRREYQDALAAFQSDIEAGMYDWENLAEIIERMKTTMGGLGGLEAIERGEDIAMKEGASELEAKTNTLAAVMNSLVFSTQSGTTEFGDLIDKLISTRGRLGELKEMMDEFNSIRQELLSGQGPGRERLTGLTDEELTRLVNLDENLRDALGVAAEGLGDQMPDQETIERWREALRNMDAEAFQQLSEGLADSEGYLTVMVEKLQGLREELDLESPIERMNEGISAMVQAFARLAYAMEGGEEGTGFDWEIYWHNLRVELGLTNDDVVAHQTSQKAAQEQMEQTAQTTEALRDDMEDLGGQFDEASVAVLGFREEIAQIPRQVTVNFAYAIPQNPPLSAYHDGGWVPGPIGADVPILAQAGEYVLSRAQIAELISGASGGSRGDTYNITVAVEGVSMDDPYVLDRVAEKIRTAIEYHDQGVRS